MRREILPDRPLRLAKRFRNNRLTLVIMVALGAVALVAITVKELRELTQLDREQHAWDHGVPCAEGSFVHTTIETKKDKTRSELQIMCLDAVGAQRHGTIVVAGAVDLLPGEETIEMRYDPEDPTVFGIETAVNAIPDRRAGAYRVIALCAFASLLAGVIAALFARPLLRMRRLARRGDEAVATITRVACKVSNGIVTDTRTVTWRIGDGPVRTTTMSGRVGLAWLHATEPHALALVGGKHAVLLTRAFAPVRLEGDELAAATAKIESARELEELADWIVISPAHAKATDRA